MFVVGCNPRDHVVASTDIVSSCLPSLPPSCQGRHPGKGPVSLSPEALVFTPRKRLSGSGRPQDGQVCRVPTSLPLDPLSSCRFPSFPQSPMTGRHWNGGGYPRNPIPRSDFGEAVTYHRRPAIAQPSRFVKISDDEPVARRTRARKTTSVGTAPMSCSSSRTRFSIAPSETESEEEHQLVSSRRSSLYSSEPALHPIRKTVGKKRSTGVFSGEN